MIDLIGNEAIQFKGGVSDFRFCSTVLLSPSSESRIRSVQFTKMTRVREFTSGDAVLMQSEER